MNYLKDAGTIVEVSMLQSYQRLSNNNDDYTVQVAAMYPAPLTISGEIVHMYTVVIEVAAADDSRVAICYNGIVMYIVENPNSKYYEDLKNNNLILDPPIAMELYND